MDSRLGHFVGLCIVFMQRIQIFLILPYISLAQFLYRPSYVYPRSLSYAQQPWSQRGLRLGAGGYQGYQQANQYPTVPISGYPVFPWGVGGIYGNSYRPNPSVVQPPSSGTAPSCPKGPYATFLSQQEQEGLHELIVEARNSGASEVQIKDYINRYMQAVLAPEKFNKFTEAMNNFNARSRFRN